MVSWKAGWGMGAVLSWVRGSGGLGGGVEGLAVEVVAGEGGDEAGFIDGLPDEVDGEGLGGSAEVAGGGEAGGGWAGGRS